MLVQMTVLWRLHFPDAAVVLLVLKRPILTVVLFQDLPLPNLRVLVMLALVSLLSLTLALHLTLAPFWMPLVLHRLVPPLTTPVPLVVLPVKLWLATDWACGLPHTKWCWCSLWMLPERNIFSVQILCHELIIKLAIISSWVQPSPWAKPSPKVYDYSMPRYICTGVYTNAPPLHKIDEYRPA